MASQERQPVHTWLSEKSFFVFLSFPQGRIGKLLCDVPQAQLHKAFHGRTALFRPASESVIFIEHGRKHFGRKDFARCFSGFVGLERSGR